MKAYLFLLFLNILIFQSCAKYVQVFETESDKARIKNSKYFFENDSVQIYFNFWSDNGVLEYEIFNKLDIPLYIDWKKSSFIVNSENIDYWNDKETNLSVGLYTEYLYKTNPDYSLIAKNKGINTSYSVSVKEERIAFIPPKSKLKQNKFYIFPFSSFDLPKTTKIKEIKRFDNPKKETKVYEKSYSKDDSPLIFRNFLTFAITEEFHNEFYVDNEFYINKISEMDLRNFEKIKKDEYGRITVNEYNDPIYISPYYTNTSFFVRIPWSESVRVKKIVVFPKKRRI